jgi:ribosomal protein S27E
MYKGTMKKIKDLSPTSGYKVEVQCPECGKIRTVYYRSICKAGHTMCQSCSAKKKMSKTIENGTKFNKLTVINASDKSGYSICRCECGNEKEVSNYELISGGTKSCGCLRSENMKKIGINPTGENHWHWKGGISNERHLSMAHKEYKDWRNDVFERDEYTCQKCSQIGGELRAHHIYNYADYPELRLDVDNGITLCEECHRKFHSINGNTTNKEQLNNFIKERW